MSTNGQNLESEITTQTYMFGKSNETVAPKELLMNEKNMAAYLGISRYFLTELRKKHGLKYLIFEGHHCIYYYLPLVDEYFRSRATVMPTDTVIPADMLSSDCSRNLETGQQQTDDNRDTTSGPFTPKRYKPMQAV